MTTLDDLLDRGDKRRERTKETGQEILGYVRIGLWSIGWLLAKLVTLLLWLVAGFFYSLGWACARVVPMLAWMKAAFLLGWQSGGGPHRVPARTR